MELYKETGTNPFASCLPILVQMPIFLALFRLLDQAAKNGKAHGVLNDGRWPSQFGNAKLFGAIPITRHVPEQRRQRRRAWSWRRSWSWR